MTAVPSGRSSGARSAIRRTHAAGSPLAVASGSCGSSLPANEVTTRRGRPSAPSATQNQNGEIRALDRAALGFAAERDRDLRRHPHPQSLERLALLGRERRVERELGHQTHRHRHDGGVGLDPIVAGLDLDAPASLGDAGRANPEADVGQQAGDGVGDRAVAASHAPVDGGFGGQASRVPAGAPRDAIQVARERPLQARLRDGARPVVARDGIQHRPHRAPVGVRRGEVRVRGLQERVELGHRDGAAAARLPPQVVDAGHARLEPQPVDRGLQDVVVRHDPLGAELGELAVLELDREDPAPHALAGLEHDHRDPGVVEVERGRQPREPGPDDHHISHVPHDPALDWLA